MVTDLVNLIQSICHSPFTNQVDLLKSFDSTLSSSFALSSFKSRSLSDDPDSSCDYSGIDNHTGDAISLVLFLDGPSALRLKTIRP